MHVRSSSPSTCSRATSYDDCRINKHVVVGAIAGTLNCSKVFGMLDVARPTMCDGKCKTMDAGCVIPVDSW